MKKKVKSRQTKSKNKKKSQIRPLTRSSVKALSKPKKTFKLELSEGPSRPFGLLFDNLINVETTAEVLGVAPKTVRKWVSVRFIPYVKIGRRVLFRQKSLELWLNQKETKSWL